MGSDKNIAIGGQAYALNALTPIRPGHEAQLRELLAAIPLGAQSPFARLRATHFARLVIIDELAFEGRRARRPQLRLQYLLFSSVFDGPLDDYLRAICDELADEAETIWGGCIGAPAPVATDAGAFARWIRHNQLRTGAFFAPYGEATVARIESSLDRCRRLREFALAHQNLSAPQLKQAYDQHVSEWGEAVA